MIGTSSQPHRRAPLLFLVMLARNRRVGVGPADIRRRHVSVAGARQGRIAKAIAASSRRRCLALRAKLQLRAPYSLMSRRQYSCEPAAAGAALPKNAAQAIAAAPKVKSFFMFSLQNLFAASRGRVKLGHPVPLSNLSKDARAARRKPRRRRGEAPLFSIEDGHRVIDRPTSGYRNDAMRIDHLDTRGGFNLPRPIHWPRRQA